MNPPSGGLELSVCIPVYNWEIRPLVERLSRELNGATWRTGVDLHLVDDASTAAERKAANREFLAQGQFANLQYSELKENIGRTKIRNLSAARAGGEYLLFLDADVLPDGDDFLGRYFAYAVKKEWEVICGGCSYARRVLPGKEYDFSYYLGQRTEAKPASFRNRKPWQYLLTSNVMVRRSCFLETPFDERFAAYGHEDTEWGIRLTRKYKVLHIDNAASHLGLVSKEAAYRKMRLAIRNFVFLAELHPETFRQSRIYPVVKWLRWFHPSSLRSAEILVEKMFLANGSLRLCFFLFQLQKAVLFARRLKETRETKSPL